MLTLREGPIPREWKRLNRVAGGRLLRRARLVKKAEKAAREREAYLLRRYLPLMQMGSCYYDSVTKG